VAEARLFDAGRLDRSELRTLGKSLRGSVPRGDHAAWIPPPGRPEPVQLLRAQDTIRVPELVPIRYGRMLASPFTFFRGSAAVMATDLGNTPTIGVNVQACGDAHCQNFGIYATPERRLVFDVNDFDETLPAPWEYDLKRLAVSLVLDARDAGWGDGFGRDLVAEAAHGYQNVLRRLSGLSTLEIQYAMMNERRFFAADLDPKVAKAGRRNLAKASRRTNKQAFRKWVRRVDGTARFVHDPPLLTPVSPEVQASFEEGIALYASTLRDDRRHIFEQFRFVDVAHKVVGVGSVGLRSYVVLMQGRGENDPMILQVKEATSSVLTPLVGKSGFARHGERVVVGQRLMQAASDPFLGWAPFAERDFYVRQLRDHKGVSDRSSSKAVNRFEAATMGGTLARSHARSVDPALLAGYVGRGAIMAKSLVRFALAYADQAEADYEILDRAARRGAVPVERGV
jgi:uncharacterized protein (DUF2252 family)